MTCAISPSKRFCSVTLQFLKTIVKMTVLPDWVAWQVDGFSVQLIALEEVLLPTVALELSSGADVEELSQAEREKAKAERTAKENNFFMVTPLFKSLPNVKKTQQTSTHRCAAGDEYCTDECKQNV